MIPTERSWEKEMARKKKLYSKARTVSANLSFSELCLLAESAGFEFRNQAGSHRIYKHPVCREMLNLQPEGGKAKLYQVRQLLRIIDRHGLIKEGK